MSITQTLEFDSAPNFDLVNTEIVGGLARLSKILNPGQNFTQSFASDSGFTYDNTKAEFAGGLIRQKDQTEDATFTNVVGVLVTGNSLKKTTASLAYDSGAISTQTITGDGWVEFTPNATGFNRLAGLSLTDPGQGFMTIDYAIAMGAAGTINIYELGVLVSSPTTYVGGDVFRVEVSGAQVLYKKNGTLIYTSLVAPSFPLFFDSSFYEQDSQIDDIRILNGATKYEENTVDLPDFEHLGVGYIIALTLLSVVEVGSPKYIIEGKYWNGSAWVVSDGSYSQASSLSVVNANLASLSLVAQTSISASVVFPDSNSLSSIDTLVLTHTHEIYAPDGYIEPIQGINVQEILELTQVDSSTVNSSVKVIIKIDGALTYWTGSAWDDSDGSFSQSNTVAEINTNLSTLDFGMNSEVIFRWVFNTTDENESATLTSATIEYDFGAIESDPETCIVYGYYKDISGQPVPGASVKFSLVRTRETYKEAANNIIEKSVTVITDANGYFESDLIRSSEYENGGTYQITIIKSADSLSTTKNPAGNALTFSVPDAVTQDITELLTA